jgi:hypothetical protein
VNFCYNRFARQAGEQRTEEIDGSTGYMSAGNGTLSLYAPDGASAVTARWRFTEGSTYAYRVSSDPHGLAVGTIVAADGVLDPGTFLKHVFTDSVIELSSPALASGEADVSFAAFTPDFTAEFVNYFRIQGTSVTMQMIKKRNEDKARLVLNELYCSYNLATPTMGTDNSSKIPGTIVIKKLTGSWKNLSLRNAVIELAGDGTSTTFAITTNHPVSIASSGLTSRLYVTNGMSASIARVNNWKGILAKEGDGMLSVGLQNLTNGNVEVRSGSLSLAVNDGVGGGDVTMGDVTLEDGTTFAVPASGIRVKSLNVNGHVVVSGGKIIASETSGDLGNITFANGASVDKLLAGEPSEGGIVFSVPQGQVVGHPAFWVDASKPETLEYTTEDDVNYVTRWNDCREGEPMFCTNLALRPRFFNGDKMSEKYVRLLQHSVTDYHNAEQLVWNEPIRGIKAVFLVQDPSDGGGAILGRCSWRLPNSLYGTWGGPFYRANYSLIDSAIVTATTAMQPVQKGRFYLNGMGVDGTKTGYLGKYMQIVEFHANTNYLSSTSAIDCDAFGGCYYNGQAQLAQCNGCMRIAEYIIYTNTLTHAERLSVAQYLSRKWLGHDILYTEADPWNTHDTDGFRIDGVGVRVEDGSVSAIDKVAGGVLSKTGEGTLYVKGLDGADLNVSAGDVILAANTLRRYVPNDTWIHVDAQATNSLTTTSGNTLGKWYDVNGTGESFRSDDFTAKAKVVENAINGHPAVDLGPTNSASESAGLVYYDAQGVASKRYTELPANMAAPLIRTAFAVYNSAAGGGPVFGGRGNGYPGKGLPHQHSKGDATPIIDEPSSYYGSSSFGIYAISNSIAQGKAVFRRNGVDIDPFTMTFLKGDERVTFAYPDGRRMANLGTYGQSGQFRGGMKYGEVIMFERILSSVEIADIEAYLAMRWFGIDTPGYGYAAGNVMVADGTSLTVLGSDFSATSLGGGGNVTGDVEITSNGTIVAVVADDGSVQTLAVTGTAKFNGGTITLAGNVGAIKPGSYAILHADALQNGGGQWIAPPKTRRNIFTVTVTSDSIYLNVLEKGLRITFR